MEKNGILEMVECDLLIGLSHPLINSYFEWFMDSDRASCAWRWSSALVVR
jgi:hypothetical protein